MYKSLLKIAGESDKKIEGMVEIKDTGISIERFEKLAAKNKFSIPSKEFYLFNPIYKYKFNLEPRVQNTLVGKVPVLRNFLTTCVYYMIQKEELV
jgi:hypothetical protein